MGADSFLNLRRWHRAAEVPFAAQFIVASRPGEQLDDLAATLPEELTIEPASAQPPTSSVAILAFRLRDLKGNSTPFYVLPGLHVEISASEIRRQVSAAIDCSSGGHNLIPDAVCEYISSHDLYR
jgi:nicotinate-nucleotide adenylyltransferase